MADNAEKEINYTLREQARDNYIRFVDFCGMIFGITPLKSVSDLKTNDRFYKLAKDIVNEFGLDWDNLSQEDNNEIFLAMLEDLYNRIRVSKGYHYDVSVVIRPIINNKEA